MFDVDEIIDLHNRMTELWHTCPVECLESDFLGLVCKQHSFNFQLWHQEDIARSPHAEAQVIANVKRCIDRLNQLRNDAIERLDDWLEGEIIRLGISPVEGAGLNTETPGSVIDRLSILSLRIYHYREQLMRKEVEAVHHSRVGQRLELCEQQLHDLSQSLKELLSDIAHGLRRHKTYRQMKMYNDKELNPYLYQSEPNTKS